MKPLSFMLIAGEASGDLLAAELVGALRERVLRAESEQTDDVQPLRTQLAPYFFGAGGPRMKALGVDLAFDLTQHSVIGISDVLKNYFKFRRLFHQLLKLAIEKQPDVIIGVDYGGFNLRFGRAIRNYVRSHSGAFHGWNPKLVQFVSPQVWASRPGRAYLLADNYDVLLSIFPFEKAWYAKRVPQLRVDFVGHPMVERYWSAEALERGDLSPTRARQVAPDQSADKSAHSKILLLPGSRSGELRRHLPVMLGAFARMKSELAGLCATMVLPGESLVQQAKSLGVPAEVEIQVGNLPQALRQADVAIASTGTITMECAYFGVPTVAIYKTSWSTYEIARRIVTVKWLAMPNLLAGEEIFPEFIQHEATAENISRAALEWLRDDARRQAVKAKLAKVIASLGGPGATARAADAIVSLLP